MSCVTTDWLMRPDVSHGPHNAEVTQNPSAFSPYALSEQLHSAGPYCHIGFREPGMDASEGRESCRIPLPGVAASNETIPSFLFPADSREFVVFRH